MNKIEELSNEEMCQMGIEMQNQIKRNYDNPAMMEIYAEELRDINNIQTKPDNELIHMFLKYSNDDCNLHNTWDEQERRWKICENEILKRLSVNNLKEVANQAKEDQLEVIREYKAVVDFKAKLINKLQKERIYGIEDCNLPEDVFFADDVIDLINEL